MVTYTLEGLMFGGIKAERKSISTLDFVFTGFSLLFPSVCSRAPLFICLSWLLPLSQRWLAVSVRGSVSQFCHVSPKPRAPPYSSVFWAALKKSMNNSLAWKVERKEIKKYGAPMYYFALITFCHPCSLCLPKYCSSDMSCHSATFYMSGFSIYCSSSWWTP